MSRNPPSGESRESFAHATAKRLLADWLTAGWNPTENLSSVDLSIDGVRECYAWQPHRPHPFGVWVEYPWDGDGTVWDETEFARVPTLEEYRAMRSGAYPTAIWDIAIQHHGRIDAAFEVVWKSDLTERKIQTIYSSTLTVYTVSAHWIISQTERPSIIKVDRRVEAFV